MKADYIYDIIENYDKSPYECILITGPWGVGKTYAIDNAIKNVKNACKVSMFGMKDAQEIYHEVFLQFALKEQKKYVEIVSKVIDIGTEASEKFAGAKRILDMLVKEKELFTNASKLYNEYHFVIIDDLERMNADINLEEVFGIIDELKKCNYVKVILIANEKEIVQKDCFNRYSEKVIDRTYYITEPPEKVDWLEMGIHSSFISKFLEKHQVKNLRTLEKAQNLYEDIMLKLKEGYNNDFYDEIRLACFAIVVETIDNLYYKEPEESQEVSTKLMLEYQNGLESRITWNYLQGIRLSNNMVMMLCEYFRNEREINDDEIDVEYEIFISAGEKPNYYKTDDEIKQLLPILADKVKLEANITKLIKYADEYFIWSEILQLEIGQMVREYETRLTSLIYQESINGKNEYLIYGASLLNLESQVNRDICKRVVEKVKIMTIDEYIRYLTEKPYGEHAYEYSYQLKNYSENMYFKDIVFERVEDLYNKELLPICNVNQQRYWLSYNIMRILYCADKDKLVAFCNDVKARCDKMAAHRIDVVLKEIDKEKRL